MRRKQIGFAVILALVLAGCSTKPSGLSEAETKVAEAEKQLEAAKKDLAAAKTTPAAKAPAPAKPVSYVLPVGTAIPVRTTTTLSTKTNTAGESFSASLREPLTLDGVELAPAGADVTGVIVSSDSGGRVKGKASLSITLKSITTKFGPLDIDTNTRQTVAQSTVKKDVIRGGIMAGAGAAIGAIAGGGKGAAIGAGVGGGAGAGTAMATKGAPAVFPPESVLNFTLKAPATLTVQP